MSRPPALRRRAARVVVVDPQGLVLMIEGFDPHHPDEPYWYTIGGGLEPGETHRDAAVREVWEETGRTITADDLLGPVHRDEGRSVYPLGLEELVRVVREAAASGRIASS